VVGGSDSIPGRPSAAISLIGATTYAGFLVALIFAALSGLVIAGRGRYRIVHGDGGNGQLQRRTPGHANFA